MPIQIFDFRFANDVQSEPEDRNVITDFGGYRQISEAGLNTVIDRFDLSCVFLANEAIEAQRFQAFVEFHRKRVPFLWAKPGATIATKWQFEKYSYRVKSIGQTLREWRWAVSIRSSFNP